MLTLYAFRSTRSAARITNLNPTHLMTQPEIPSASHIVLVGLDRGDHRMHAAILSEASTQPSNHREFAAGAEALHGFFDSLRMEFPHAHFLVGFEQPAPGLLHALMDQPDITLHPMNPSQTARFREALSSSRKKDDPTDAQIVLTLLKTHRDHFPAWKPEREDVRLLRLLVEGRRKAVDTRTRSAQVLLALLKNTFPQAPDLCGDSLCSPLAIALLDRWPTLQAIQKSRPSTLRSFFYKHNVRSSSAVETRIERIASARPLSSDPALLEASSLQIRTLLGQIRSLNASIDAYDKRIAKLAPKLPAYPVVRSFPGAGPAFAPRLTAAFGSALAENLPDATALACLCGIAPIIKRSGKSSSTQRRLARPKFLHQTFLEYADISICFSPWARAFFKLKRSQGKSRWEALRALAFKWIRIMFRCVASNSPYSDPLYTASLRKKCPDIIPFLDLSTSSQPKTKS